MSDWPWYLCLACEKAAPERCQQHRDGSPDETPYQTLTRWGSLQLVLRKEDAIEFRSQLRREARADKLRIRTFVLEASGDLGYVIAQLADYRLRDEEELERLRDAFKALDWGEGDRDDAES